MRRATTTARPAGPARSARSAPTWRTPRALLPLLVALLGCQGAGPAVGPEPVRVAEPALVSPPFDTDGLLSFVELPDLAAPRQAGALISARDGGSVELAGFRVDVPAGALATDTWVTIDLPTSLPLAGWVVAELGPSGTTFAKPVTITMPLEGVAVGGLDLDEIGISYWNGSSWEDYGGVAGSGGVRGTTTHFSTYGARRRGGVDTTSGG